MSRRPGCREGFLDLRHGWIRIALQQLRGNDHHSALAEPAQRSLLFDPGLLDRMQRLLRLFRREPLQFCPSRGQTLQRGDFLVVHRRNRRDAGTDFLAVNQHGTRTALSQPAAKLRTAELQVIAQDIQQWRIAGCADLVTDPIHRNCGHRDSLHGHILKTDSTRQIMPADIPISPDAPGNSPYPRWRVVSSRPRFKDPPKHASSPGHLRFPSAALLFSGPRASAELLDTSPPARRSVMWRRRVA